MIKHLFMDFDRTLNDSDCVYEKNLHGFLGLSGQEVRQHWEAIHWEVVSKEPREKHEDLEHHFQRLIGALKQQDPEAVKRELKSRIVSAQQECWRATALFKDAIPFLARMHAASYTLHIATGDYAQKKAEAIEQQAGRSFFDLAFDESVLGVGKGKRDYFDLALARLKVQPGDAMVFGDSLANDIGPAKEAGIRAAWVRRKSEKASSKVTPDLIFTSLDESLRNFTGAWTF